VSANVWLAFGGVFLLGLIGFLVAWFSKNKESLARESIIAESSKKVRT